MLALAGLLAVAPLQPAMAASVGTADQLSSISSGPQWVTSDQRAATHLIALLQSSDLDGLNPNRFNIKQLVKSLSAASDGSLSSADKANALFDKALVDYVTALRTTPFKDWAIVDRAAIPAPPSASELLAEAAAAPSLERWVDTMPFMHPGYSELRRALATARSNGDPREPVLRANLDRIRLLPAAGRYVLVNIAAQRLYMYEDGQPVDTMKVVVGKPVNPTPMIAGMIRSAAVNPYWNVPADLAAERIAPHVVKQGLGYLKQLGYVVLSDWGDQATEVDPSTIDWNAVAEGRIQVRLRQNPGPHNAMGQMKFMFPNNYGVYLHDTPDKELLNEAARLFSGGCVRLEDAPRLGRWLFGQPLVTRGKEPEQPVELDWPVPIYLAYLTAETSDGQIVFHDDIYRKDGSRVAAASDGRVAAN